MDRKYWLDLFTGKTWEEFLRAGANVSGFRERRRKVAQKIHVGDYLICYVTVISRFIGVLEVLSECFVDTSPIWEDAEFPVRFKVKLIYKLDPKTAIPVFHLSDKLSFFKNIKSKHAWTGFFRGSPQQFDPKDAKVIIKSIEDAIKSPTERDFDEKKYLRRPKIYESKLGRMTIPEEEDKEQEEIVKSTKENKLHNEIQYLLLKLGSDLGLGVRVARNDRNKQYEGQSFKNLPGFRNELPRQFDEATNKTIEFIDVLWLQGDEIIAAFEVEHSSSIYSGLLRMSDLISMKPNIKINLYIVAPDERREKVFEEINRPTFKKLKPPLPTICKFIPYAEFKKEIQLMGHRIRRVNPEFIDDIAESCDSNET